MSRHEMMGIPDDSPFVKGGVRGIFFTIHVPTWLRSSLIKSPLPPLSQRGVQEDQGPSPVVKGRLGGVESSLDVHPCMKPGTGNVTQCVNSQGCL